MFLQLEGLKMLIFTMKKFVWNSDFVYFWIMHINTAIQYSFRKITKKQRWHVQCAGCDFRQKFYADRSRIKLSTIFLFWRYNYSVVVKGFKNSPVLLGICTNIPGLKTAFLLLFGEFTIDVCALDTRGMGDILGLGWHALTCLVSLEMVDIVKRVGLL